MQENVNKEKVFIAYSTRLRILAIGKCLYIAFVLFVKIKSSSHILTAQNDSAREIVA